MPQSIEKILFPTLGDASVVQLVSDTLPDPPAAHIQLENLYSGVSTTDVNMRNGTYPMQKKAPLTPGYCVVGRVHMKGPNCTSKFNKGDLVCSLTVYDAEATYMNVSEKHLIPVPWNMASKLESVTAVLVDWSTAYGMVYRAAKVKKGDRVFVHGMSGAVGWALFQLCQLQGATVYGTASAKNHAEIQAAGGIPFDYRNKQWITDIKALGGVHAVFDPLGFESWDESWDILSLEQPAVLVGYGGNMQTFNGGETRSVVWPTTKLLAKNLCFSKRSTKFYYIDKDQKTYVPEVLKLFELVGGDEVEVRIKKVLGGLGEIKGAHEEWNRIEGMGSVVVKIV